MAAVLIPCPACNHQCSTAAPTCPGCGHVFARHQRSKSLRVQSTVAILLMLASIGWAFFCVYQYSQTNDVMWRTLMMAGWIAAGLGLLWYICCVLGRMLGWAQVKMVEHSGGEKKV